MSDLKIVDLVSFDFLLFYLILFFVFLIKTWIRDGNMTVTTITKHDNDMTTVTVIVITLCDIEKSIKGSERMIL